MIMQAMVLPLDLLVTIVMLSEDVVTLVRFASTCKDARGAICNCSRFRDNANHDDFDPSLFLGFIYHLHSKRGCRTIHKATSSARLKISPSNWEELEPMASRDGLLVLRYWRHPAPVLYVCNTLTGAVTTLPPLAVGAYWLSLLTVSDAGRSFELLIADHDWRIQIFRSEKGELGATLDRAVSYLTGIYYPGRLAQPAIVGSTVHWLSNDERWNPVILALDMDRLVVTTLPTPPIHDLDIINWTSSGSVRLLASFGGRLRLLVADALGVVSMWTWTTAQWERQAVLSVVEIERRVGLDVNKYRSKTPILLVGFGERTGSLILAHMHKRELVCLNLATKRATALGKFGRNKSDWISYLFVHEVDSAALLRDMRSSPWLLPASTSHPTLVAARSSVH